MHPLTIAECDSVSPTEQRRTTLGALSSSKPVSRVDEIEGRSPLTTPKGILTTPKASLHTPRMPLMTPNQSRIATPLPRRRCRTPSPFAYSDYVKQLGQEQRGAKHQAQPGHASPTLLIVNDAQLVFDVSLCCREKNRYAIIVEEPPERIIAEAVKKAGSPLGVIVDIRETDEAPHLVMDLHAKMPRVPIYYAYGGGDTGIVPRPVKVVDGEVVTQVQDLIDANAVVRWMSKLWWRRRRPTHSRRERHMHRVPKSTDD